MRIIIIARGEMAGWSEWDPTAPRIRRVVLVVMDGLRADLVGVPDFPALAALRAESAYTLNATTVLPSVTAAAMTSLLSGVAPCDHGVTSDQFRVPPHSARLRPLSREIAAAGMATTGVVRQVPWPLRGVARRIVRELGLGHAHFAPANVEALIRAAHPALTRQCDGLVLLHWPDCDAAGHRDGWMSPRYLAAVARMDVALQQVRDLIADRRHDTLLVVLADHGGGGRVAHEHDSAHPHDCTIPILVHGPGVHAQVLPDSLTLLDVPATVLWALGLAVPARWAGTPIEQAFRPLPQIMPVRNAVVESAA